MWAGKGNVGTPKCSKVRKIFKDIKMGKSMCVNLDKLNPFTKSDCFVFWNLRGPKMEFEGTEQWIWQNQESFKSLQVLDSVCFEINWVSNRAPRFLSGGQKSAVSLVIQL